MDLWSNHIGDLGAITITWAFNEREDDLKLTCLNFWDNEIGKSIKFKEFVDEFSKIIEKDQLKWIDLSWNNIKGEHARVLGSKFSALDQLEHLDLSQNLLGTSHGDEEPPVY